MACAWRVSTVIGIPQNYRVSHLPIDEIGLRFESITVAWAGPATKSTRRSRNASMALPTGKTMSNSMSIPWVCKNPSSTAATAGK